MKLNRIFNQIKFITINNILVWLLSTFVIAICLEVVLIPNRLVDGGMVGVSMALGRIFGDPYIPLTLAILNLPFLYFSTRIIGSRIFIGTVFCSLMFSIWLIIIRAICETYNIFFIGDSLEVVFIAGSLLGVGCGFLIRFGGCLDGSEVLGLMMNKIYPGITVGQVVLLVNIFVFSFTGFVSKDLHSTIMSMITYFFATNIMDRIIMGSHDEYKYIWVFSEKNKEICECLEQYGIDFVVFSGKDKLSMKSRNVVCVMFERLLLSDIKKIIHTIDENAFLAIGDLNDVKSISPTKKTS